MVAKFLIQSILFVDDNHDDCDIFTEILKELNPFIKLICINEAKDIQLQALYLKPDLIFLDGELPFIDGISALSYLKTFEELKTIPVIIYSSFTSQKAIDTAYNSGANLFVKKQTNVEQTKAILKTILALNWVESEAITKQHLIDGKYHSF